MTGTSFENLSSLLQHHPARDVRLVTDGVAKLEGKGYRMVSAADAGDAVFVTLHRDDENGTVVDKNGKVVHVEFLKFTL